VDFIGNIPILKENAVTTKFFSMYMPQIVNKVAQKSYGEGYQAAVTKKAETPKTMNYADGMSCLSWAIKQ
jgi:hypothetical protein